jgi:hypothetical protein
MGGVKAEKGRHFLGISPARDEKLTDILATQLDQVRSPTPKMLEPNRPPATAHVRLCRAKKGHDPRGAPQAYLVYRNIQHTIISRVAQLTLVANAAYARATRVGLRSSDGPFCHSCTRRHLYEVGQLFGRLDAVCQHLD